MLTRYVIGAWLIGRGYDLFELPPPYAFGLTDEANRAAGRWLPLVS